MKPWQLAIGLLGGGVAAVLAFKGVRAVQTPQKPLDVKAPPTGPGPEASPPLDVLKPKADEPTDTYNVKTGGASAPLSPIPANALPYFLSGADGSFAYYVPAEPPKDRLDLFTPMGDPPAVGVKAAACVSFTHGKTQKDAVAILAPIPVVVEAIDAGGAIKVRTNMALVAASTDAAVKDTPLPDGVSWTVPSFAMLGVPSKAWFDTFTYSNPETTV